MKDTSTISTVDFGDKTMTNLQDQVIWRKVPKLGKKIDKPHISPH